jgi:hypothetical protein
MWAGPPTDLTLWLVGAFDVQVEVASGFKIRRTPNTAKHLNFTVTTNDEVTIVANLQNGFQMRLLEGRDGIGEIVRLRNVEPLSQR